MTCHSQPLEHLALQIHGLHCLSILVEESQFTAVCNGALDNQALRGSLASDRAPE